MGVRRHASGIRPRSWSQSRNVTGGHVRVQRLDIGEWSRLLPDICRRQILVPKLLRRDV